MPVCQPRAYPNPTVRISLLCRTCRIVQCCRRHHHAVNLHSRISHTLTAVAQWETLHAMCSCYCEIYGCLTSPSFARDPTICVGDKRSQVVQANMYVPKPAIPATIHKKSKWLVFKASGRLNDASTCEKSFSPSRQFNLHAVEAHD